MQTSPCFLPPPREAIDAAQLLSLAVDAHLRGDMTATEHFIRSADNPIIRAEVRKRIANAYPKALPWGRTNLSQHAAFQAMWAQYDHLVPHCKGGDNSVSNIVVTCAPCNFARMDYLLEEVGLSNPLLREPTTSDWGGLEHFR